MLVAGEVSEQLGSNAEVLYCNLPIVGLINDFHIYVCLREKQ